MSRATNWIPVSERLPEKHKDVITTVKYNGFLGMYGTWLRTAFIGDYGEFDIKHFEVVGNIFDNKELLQEGYK